MRLKQEGVTQDEINMRRYTSAREKNSFPVFQYSLDGTFLKEYPSVQVARKETNIGHIEKCCNGQQKQAGGYIWSYSKHDRVAPVENNNPATRKKPVFQYDLSGAQISGYPSAYHAEKATGINQTAIKNVCIGESHTAGGYIWRYEDSPQIQVVLPNNTGKSKCVGKFDAQTGKLIETYCSLAEAAEKNNIAISGISSACTGRYKSCGGFIWHYV